ncbi:MAG: sensor histidine kinase [Candidatus Binataceae bacterium]
MEQVFTNLLTNAAKYTDPGGRIKLTAEREGEQVVVRISDNGIGIEPGLLPHVFEMYTQSERSLARSESGLGIGLSVAKTFVELHGGTIEARSDGSGHGSEFIVRFPVRALAGRGPRPGLKGDRPRHDVESFTDSSQ